MQDFEGHGERGLADLRLVRVVLGGVLGDGRCEAAIETAAAPVAAEKVKSESPDSPAGPAGARPARQAEMLC